MTSDPQDSHRKHRRSPSNDESQEQSKRHKNRHHHRRHHRRHHKHSIKKHDHEGEASIEKVEASMESVGFDQVSNDNVVSKGIVNYDDIEEGEILEEGEIVGGEIEIGGDKGGLDTESSEIKASDSDNSTMGAVNGDVGHQSNTGSFGTHGRYKSPARGKSKQEVQFDIEGVEQNLVSMDVKEGEQRSGGDSKYCRRRGNRHERLSFSPSQRRYSEETADRNMSNSSEYLRMKSLHNERDDNKHNNENFELESGDEKVTIPKGSDLLKIEDKEKGCSGIRNDKREFGHYGHESGYGDRAELYRDQTMKKGRETESRSLEREKRQARSRDKCHEKVKNREKAQQQSHILISNGVLDRDRGPEQDRRQSREQDYDREMRDSGRALHRDSDMEKGRRKEKDHGSVQERDYENDRRIDSSWGSYRDRDAKRAKESDHGGSRERDYARERRKDRSRASYRDREMEREWEERSSDIKSGRERDLDRSRRDRYGDKLRDAESDRAGRYCRYDDDEYGDRGRYHDSRRHEYDAQELCRDKIRNKYLEKEYISKDDSKASKNKSNRNEYEQNHVEDVIELRSLEQEEEDIKKIKEESRRRREAILQKYKAKQQQEAEYQIRSVEKVPIKDLTKVTSQTAITDDCPDSSDTKGQPGPVLDADDFNNAFSLGKSPPQNGIVSGGEHSGAGGLGEGTPKSERPNDMFCDGIFGDSPAGALKMGKGDGSTIQSSGLCDNWDDPEGYYSHRFGEILDGRYEIVATHGKGVFSTVVRAKDLKAGIGDPDEVAIKVIRNNETMLKAGMEELIILKKLVGADPGNRRHCVRFISSFKYRNHLCLVFESLHMNLREVLKKFGRNIGLKLTAVRAYAKQLFIALKHLRNCGVLHCDIKPDNMLVNDAKNVLKLCDFGNAMFAGKNEITPYLVSRFYRAPEIILGLPYDHPMDIWSVGCCLYELYTGKVLFPGLTNNDMLRLHMELKGAFPKKMLRKGGFIDHHFDQDLNFVAIEEDPITKKTIRKLVLNIKPKDIGTIIKGYPGEDLKMVANFKDLLEKIFVLDPDKRLTVSQALSHPFITGK